MVTAMPAATAVLRRGEPGFLRVSAALFVGGTATFALLYHPQAILPALSAEFGLSPATASLCVSATTAALVLTVLPLSLLAHRYGPVRLMNVALYAGALLCLAEAVAPSFWLLVALRAGQGLVISGFVAVATAYLATVVHHSGLGLAGGLYIGGTAFGGMLGRLLVGVVSEGPGWRVAVGALGCVTLACGIGFTRLVPQARPRIVEPARRRLRLPRDSLLIRLYATGFLLTSVFVAATNYLGYRLHDDPFRLSDAAIGTIFVVYLAGAASSPAAGRLADQSGFRTALLAAVTVLLAGVGMLVPTNLVLIVIGFGLLTIGFFAAHSTANTWVGARANDKISANASYVTAYYLGSTIGGWQGGLPYALGGWPALTGYLTSLTLVIAGIAVTTPTTPAMSGR